MKGERALAEAPGADEQRAPVEPCRLEPLLVVGARLAVGTATSAQLARAAGETRDWAAVLAQAREHRMAPLLHKQLAALDPSPVPDEPRARLLDLYRASVQRSLRMAARLNELLDLFEGAGIPALPYKGPVLAVQAYGDAGLRPCTDLDLLVPREHLLRAGTLLVTQGFVRRANWPPGYDARLLTIAGELQFQSDDGDYLVELHERVGASLRRTWIPAERLMERAGIVDLLGRPTPAPRREDALLIACVHGAKHEWERLEQVASTGCLMRDMNAAEWDRLCQEAAGSRTQRRVDVGVEVLSVALGLAPPAPPNASAAAVLTRSLARSSLHGLQHGRPQGPRAEAARILRAALAEDDPVACAGALLRRFLAPGPEDWQSYDLPAGTWRLYWALRPVRLAVKWGKRALESAKG